LSDTEVAMTTPASSTAKPPRPRLPAQLVAIVAPDVGMPRVAREGKARWALLFAMLCSLAFAGAQATRVSAREETLQQLEMSGQLKDMSDRQIEEQAKSSEHKFVVKTAAAALFKEPLLCLAYLICLYALSWFLRGRSNGGAIAAVSAAALLPGALRDLLSAGAALMHSTLPTEGPPLVPSTFNQISALLGHPMMGMLAPLGNALDLFSLWAALLFGFGLAAAASLSRTRALAGALVAWTLWRLLYACAFHLGG